MRVRARARARVYACVCRRVPSKERPGRILRGRSIEGGGDYVRMSEI